MRTSLETSKDKEFHRYLIILNQCWLEFGDSNILMNTNTYYTDHTLRNCEAGLKALAILLNK